MPRIKESIDINALRGDVFRFCHDAAGWPNWAAQITGVELLSPAPLRRGALLRFDARFGGGAVFSWEAEVTEYQPPAALRLRAIDTAGSSPFAAGSELSWEFNAVGNGTRFTWIWDYQPHGFFGNLLDRLGRQAATQREIRRSLETLKKLVEAGQKS